MHDVEKDVVLQKESDSNKEYTALLLPGVHGPQLVQNAVSEDNESSDASAEKAT